jgi:hypothetical protein
LLVKAVPVAPFPATDRFGMTRQRPSLSAGNSSVWELNLLGDGAVSAAAIFFEQWWQAQHPVALALADSTVAVRDAEDLPDDLGPQTLAAPHRPQSAGGDPGQIPSLRGRGPAAQPDADGSLVDDIGGGVRPGAGVLPDKERAFADII